MLKRRSKGLKTKDPVYELDSVWIRPERKEEAEKLGYTTIDLPIVISTHISEILKQYSYEIFGRQEADHLINNFKKSYPKVVEEVLNSQSGLGLGLVVKVLQNLLKEGVSIRDLLSIF